MLLFVLVGAFQFCRQFISNFIRFLTRVQFLSVRKSIGIHDRVIALPYDRHVFAHEELIKVSR